MNSPAGDGEGADRQRQLEVAVRLDRPERAHRRAAADGLEPRDVVDRGDLRRARDRAARERRAQDLGEADAGPQPAFDGRDEMRHARELALRHQLGPADRPDLAHAREIVALQVDDHHVLGGVLRVVDVLADRARALDRHRPEPLAAAREEELRRGGDDRPAVAEQRPRVQRRERRERSREPRRVALEARGEVLDEVDLVDVATRDRGAHLVDRGAVVVGRPRLLPLPDPERSSSDRLLTFVRGPDAGRHDGQRAGLRRRRPRLPAERLREAVAEVDVGDETFAQLVGQVLLERLECAGRLVELKHRRSAPRGA